MPRLILRHTRSHPRRVNPTRLTHAAALLALAVVTASPAQAAPIGVYNQYFVTGEASAVSGSSADASYRCDGGNGSANADKLGGCVSTLGSVPLVNSVTGTADSSARCPSQAPGRWYWPGWAPCWRALGGAPRYVLLNRLDHVLDHLLGVVEHHHGLVHAGQLVAQANVAGSSVHPLFEADRKRR